MVCRNKGGSILWRDIKFLMGWQNPKFEKDKRSRGSWFWREIQKKNEALIIGKISYDFIKFW